MLTDPLSLGLTAIAGALALSIAWVQWPRPPALDGERWFKLTLATLLRGRVEGTGGSADDWERQVRDLVPYHPAGRLPERKVSNPLAATLPSAALPGEQALLEALAQRSEVAARWAWLYDQDPAALEARTADPAELGAAYDWTVLGPGASWDTLAAWGSAARGSGNGAFLAAARRAVPDRFVLFSGRPDRLPGPSLLDAMAAELPDAVRIPWGSTELAEAVAKVCETPEQRAVLVAEEAAVAEVLRMLEGHAEVRDRVSAVLSIGGVIGGRTDEDGPYGEKTCADWLGAHFNQNDLDTELVRLTPYLAVQWLHRSAWPPGAPGLPLAHSRFPEPALNVPVETIEVVDLGVLDAERALPVELAARALLAVTLGWVRSRR